MPLISSTQPLYLQRRGYPARLDRQLIGDMFTPGVRSLADLTPTVSGTGRAVNIAAGVVYVAGTESTDQGTYRASFPAATVFIDPASTFVRLDQIIVRIYDSQESGSLNEARIEIVPGVEANTATLDNRLGAAAVLPPSSLLLCDVGAPVGSGLLASTDIRDRRVPSGARIGGLPVGAQIYTASSVLPSSGGVWDWADGGLIDRVTYAAFFAAVGHAYNAGVDPGSLKVRKPDKRGRASFGADNMGSGAAGRLVGNPSARGGGGGVEAYALTGAEGAPHTHSPGGSNVDFLGQTGGAPVGWLAATGTNGVAAAATTGPIVSGGAPHQNMPPNQIDNVIVRIA